MRSDFDNCDNMGIEEAEMYARFAAELTIGLNEDRSEARIAAVRLLINKSRRIMRNLINQQFHRSPPNSEGEQTAARR